MAAYPESFPIIDALRVVEIIKSGKIAENKNELALKLWWCQGYAQKMMIGDPLVKQAILADIDPVDALERAAKAYESGAVLASSIIPWGTILHWALTELLKLLEEATN